jgi:AcrR family transcriptional regulator
VCSILVITRPSEGSSVPPPAAMPRLRGRRGGPGTLGDAGAATQQRHGDRRRRQIIDAALAEVRAQPIAEVRLAAITARAGLGASHALYYFGSRDGVLVAAVAHAEQQLVADRRDRLETIDDPIGRLAAFVDA